MAMIPVFSQFAVVLPIVCYRTPLPELFGKGDKSLPNIVWKFEKVFLYLLGNPDLIGDDLLLHYLKSTTF
jgi:hypothetical protein